MKSADLAISVLGPGIDSASFSVNSFIDLGGDSIRAMRLVALARERAGLQIPLKSLLSEIPLAEVLNSATADPDAHDEITHACTDFDKSVTPSQRGMWLTERVAEGSQYNLVFLCLVERGWLEEDMLRRAVRRTVARHEGLRTVFRESVPGQSAVRQGEGGITRDVLPAYEPEVPSIAFGESGGDFGASARRLAAELGGLPFDVSAAPALRFWLLSHTSGRQALVVAAHHMLLDGWAAGLLLREVLVCYDELHRGVPQEESGAAVPMRSLLRHQERQRASGKWNRQAHWWREHLAGAPTLFELPADRERASSQDTSGVRIPVDIGTEVSAAIAAGARTLGVTPFAFLLGAFALTLSRRTGVKDLLVGVPVIGRGTGELMGLIAYAGNLVPVRINVDDDAAPAQYLRSVQESLAASIDAGDLPFEELVSRLGAEGVPVRTPGRHPLVQVSCGMHDQLLPERITTSSVEVAVEEGHGGGSQFDLSLMIGRSRPSLAGYLEFAAGVWSQAEAEAFAADFLAVAGELTAAATAATALEARLGDVRGVCESCRSILEKGNETGRDFPAVSLDELFRAVARRWPAAVAVRGADGELTYERLADAAAEQARLLREAGVRPGDIVLIGVERSTAEAVAVLGTVWAGAAYVGIDLEQPPAFVERIVARAAPAAALTGRTDAGILSSLGVPVVDTWAPGWSPAPRETAHPVPDPGRLAYVAFTSGSTGEPKGVAIPHRAVTRLVHDVSYVELGPGARMLRLSPLAFDASTLELWGALLTGATLEVAPAGLLSPGELGAFLTERGVTVAWLTAGLFRLVEEFAPDSLRGLRQLLTGGDVVPHEHVARALARSPGLVITNGYGPTENTTFTTVHSVHRAADVDGPLPIGTPVPGTRVYVLDSRGRLVPPGAIGELYTGGEGLALGYLGDPAGTSRRFGRFSPDVPEVLYRTGDLVRMDTQGRLRFLGRADDQVKIRGYRVELNAISSALMACPGVRDAIVTVTDSGSAGKRIIAAVVPAQGAPDSAPLEPADLRDHLADRLPSYMVPSLWAVVDRVPVTANGKVDRRTLADIAVPVRRAARQRAAGDSGLDRVLALFAEAIDSPADGAAGSPGPGGTAGLGADSDFFKAGGNSLAAVRLMGLAKERLGVSLRLRDFLLAPTPAGLARMVGVAAGAAEVTRGTGAGAEGRSL